jgi:hypothetical protein
MRSSAVAMLAALAMNLGCSSARPLPPVTAPAALAPPDEADAIAQEAVDARVTVLLHLDRLQGFRFSRELVMLGGWDAVLAGTGLDALRDVKRAFIAAHASHNGDVALVLQHTASEERVGRAIVVLREKWEASRRMPAPPIETEDAPPAGPNGDPTQSPPPAERVYKVRLRDLEYRLAQMEPRWPDPVQFPFPAAYLDLKNEFAHTNGPVLVAAPHPGLLVVLPMARAFAAYRLMEVGGLPAPAAGEAMVFRAWDPEKSIQNGPLWSPEVRYAEAMFTFDATGDSTLKFRAVCSSAEAAKTQAERMTSQVEDAQSFSLGGVKLRLFDFIEFHAEKDRVKMGTRLSLDDVDWLMAMTMKPL